MSFISQITIGEATYDIKDAGARQLISDLGDAVYWIGVTTTELEDGDTTNPITVNSESVTAKTGGMAQYDGEEFVWNGSAWQSIGKNNFGDFAFVDQGEASYTPAGTVSQPTASASTTSATVYSITDVGTLPTMSVSGEVLTLAVGTLPTKGEAQTVVGSVDSVTVTQPTFSGTAATITVNPKTSV